MLFLGREVTRSPNYSEATAQRIDAETGRILREAFAQARQILESHRDVLEKIAAALIERETLDGVDVDDLLKHGRIRTDEERLAAESATPPTGA
jgi:cell division protease FtsH